MTQTHRFPRVYMLGHPGDVMVLSSPAPISMIPPHSVDEHKTVIVNHKSSWWLNFRVFSWVTPTPNPTPSSNLHPRRKLIMKYLVFSLKLKTDASMNLQIGKNRTIHKNQPQRN